MDRGGSYRSRPKKTGRVELDVETKKKKKRKCFEETVLGETKEMKIYVAGKWKDRKRILGVMNKLKVMGHEITCDWTKHTSHVNMWKHAVEDIEGVRNCDLLLAIMIEKYDYKGAWAEIGAALALDKRVVVVGTGHNGGVFLAHPNIFNIPDVSVACAVVMCWGTKNENKQK